MSWRPLSGEVQGYMNVMRDLIGLAAENHISLLPSRLLHSRLCNAHFVQETKCMEAWPCRTNPKGGGPGCPRDQHWIKVWADVDHVLAQL